LDNRFLFYFKFFGDIGLRARGARFLLGRQKRAAAEEKVENRLSRAEINPK
jgi:hypothetical protein